MKRKDFIALVLSYINFPAVNYGGELHGNSPSGFDCSGFINFILKMANYPGVIPRHANEMFDSLGILVHEQFCEAGDLIFFSNRGGTYPDHVGIIITQNAYVHSPGKNGALVCARQLEAAQIVPRDGKPQIYFSNPIGFKRLTVQNGRYQQMFLTE